MTRDEFLARFQRVSDGTARVRGDHDLNPGMMDADQPLREAAVLAGLVDRPGGLTLLFTQRTPHLTAHAGQISFPGGRLEPDDDGPQAAALRETLEEIGLPAERVTLVGRLDTYITRTGFRITPVVGLIEPPFELTVDPFEVAEAFEVPLDFFLQPHLPKTHDREVFGSKRQFYAFPWRDRYIWGATAGMLVNLRDALAAGAAESAA